MRDPVERVLRNSLVLSLFLLLPTAARAQHFPPSEEVELMLRYLVEDGKAVGIVVGLLKADGSTRVVSYGSPGPDALPLGPHSLFETGSIGKTFTATLLADMVMKGEVALEDPVAVYLPDTLRVPSLGGREITVLDLATHRSGLPKNADNHQPADLDNPYADFTFETIYDFLAGHQLRREPGAQFEYSNLGFQLLGHALARTARTTYTNLLEDRILDPLNMTNAGPEVDGENAAHMVRGHRNGSVVPYWTGTEARLGAGGQVANVEDMLKYLDANVGPPESELERAMRNAHEPRRPWGTAGAEIGLAWKSDSIDGRWIVEHGGNTLGFTSLIAFDPEREVGIVWLTNTFAFTDPTPRELLVQGRRPTIQEVQMTPAALASFAGEYRYASGPSVHIRMEDEGFLTIQTPRRARSRIFASSDTSFSADRGDSRVIFDKNEAGEVRGIRVDQFRPGETARKIGGESPSPRAVATGNEWHRIAIDWRGAYWILLAVPALLVVLTLGAEFRRRSRARTGRGS